MIYYKNGRIYSKHFSYQLPEELMFDFGSTVEIKDGFSFISPDKRFTLEIYTQKLTSAGTIDALDEDDEFVSMTPISAVTRGGLCGKCLFYRSPEWLHEYYEEHLELEEELVLDICVTINDGRNKHEQIFDVMKEPVVVSFLNSIKAE